MEAIDVVLQSAHEREAYAKGSATRILNFLADLEQDIDGKLRARIARMSERDKANFVSGRLRGQYSTDRLQALLDSIKELSERWAQITSENVNLSAKELAAGEIALNAEVMALQGVIGPQVSISQVVSAAYAQPLMAKPLNEYFKDQKASVRRTVTQSLRRSFVAGETVDQAVKSLIGTKALAFKDGEMKKHRDGVRMLVRTSFTHIANVSTQETFKQLGVEKWRFLSVLDSRTSKICGGLSGTEWSVSNSNAPYPPRHSNCRSIAIWADDSLEGETQASNMSSPKQVDASLTYEELLKRQPIEFQREQFTALQWKLWRSGKVKLRGLSDTKGTRELTDGQLRDRYSSIISRIGDTRQAA